MQRLFCLMLLCAALGPSISAQEPDLPHAAIEDEASLSTVWNLFTNISAWPDWHKEIESASLQSPLSVGAVFHWGTAGLNIASTIGELVPQQRIAWARSE